MQRFLWEHPAGTLNWVQTNVQGISDSSLQKKRERLETTALEEGT